MTVSIDARPGIVVRDIRSIPELRAVEEIQQEVWGFEERDIVPAAQLAPSVDVGGILIGAFDAQLLAGFVYGFVGVENGTMMIHSAMLAVRSAYRDCGLGYRLKMAQRERALANGIRLVTWTFDPLQARNAHFNFAKLGVLSTTYKVDYYGESSSSFLHAYGTDRLWVHWMLDSLRVSARVKGKFDRTQLPPEVTNAPRIVALGSKGKPRRSSFQSVGPQAVVSVEIPGDFMGFVQHAPDVAREWREATRRAFAEAIGAGYVVEEFYHETRAGQSVGVYVLKSAPDA